MVDTTEELEPLFDYRRVQPFNIICVDDDDCSDSTSVPSPKRRKIPSTTTVEKEEKDEKVIRVVKNQKEDEDWLPPPPKVTTNVQKFSEDSTLKELRLKKQELVSFAQTAEDVLRAVEESVKREHSSSVPFSLESAEKEQSKPPCKRAKVTISVQDKEGLKRLCVFMDDKFERIFKIYADRAKLDLQSLVFRFDGDKISPTATPISLGMEDDDIIEVHVKAR